VADQWFESATAEQARAVRDWSGSARVAEVITAQPRMVHGDLKADQVFVTDEGYRGFGHASAAAARSLPPVES